MSFELTKTIYPGWIYKSLLNKDQCVYYRGILDNLARKERNPRKNYLQDIIRLPELANEIWKQIKNNLPKKVKLNNYHYELIGLSDHVTISKHTGKNIGIHQDKDVQIYMKGRKLNNLYCLFKLALYLNDLSDPDNPNDRTGGTHFYDRRGILIYTVKPGEGDGLLFDMREWHSGTRIPRGQTKYMLGFRPVYERVLKRSSEEHEFKEIKETRELRKIKELKRSQRKPRKYCRKCHRYH